MERMYTEMEIIVEYIQRFIDSISNANTKKVVKSVLYNADDIETLSFDELENFIIQLKPNSPKSITTISYVLDLYGRWLQEQNVCSDLSLLIKNIDKKALWKQIKPTARKRFISYDEYQDIIQDILKYEEYNPLYYSVLFRCIYEGIYSDDMSVLKNLRTHDIMGDELILHEDNKHTYRYKIPMSLSYDLQELSEIDIWQRPNRYGICRVKMRGFYPDSIFKVEDRSTAVDDSYRFCYYAKLRKIANDHIGYTMLPLHIFISGIMYRLKISLLSNGITLEEAFSEKYRIKLAHQIIKDELNRCNYTSDIENFREIVKGNLDSF